MDSKRKKITDVSRFNLYVRTSRENYFIEYACSIVVAVSFLVIFHFTGSSSHAKLLGLTCLSAITTFRIVEFLLTKKHIYRYIFYIEEGTFALLSVVTEVLILGVAYYYALFK